MINWLELFSYVLIIIPLSIISALLSNYWYRARVGEVPVRQLLESKTPTTIIYTCGLIIAVRMVVFSQVTWLRVVWLVAALLIVYWFVDMLRARRQTTGEQAP